MDIKFFKALEEIAKGSLLVKKNDTFDLSKLNGILKREATKRDLIITVKYISKKTKYEFVVYEESGRR